MNPLTNISNQQFISQKRIYFKKYNGKMEKSKCIKKPNVYL